MPEQWAADLAWLGGGAIFAGLMCAFAQFAALLPARLQRSHAPLQPRCGRDAPHKSRVVIAISFALLLTVPPGVIAAGGTHAIDATVAVQIGVMAGLVCASRHEFSAYVRAVALCGIAMGAMLIGGAFLALLLSADLALSARAACFSSVATGAMLAGGALGAFAHRARGPQAVRIPFNRVDRAVHVVALLLGVALGWRFIAVRTSPECSISVLIAASVLGAALGARLMSGAHKTRDSRLRAKPRSVPELFRSTFHASFAGVSDERLVAACVGGMFEPAWLDSSDDSGDAGRSHHHAPRDLPRRRRSRRGALRQRQGPH